MNRSYLLFAAILFIVASIGYAQQKLEATIFDTHPSLNPNFENLNNGLKKGIVLATLKDTKVPTLNPNVNLNEASISDPSYFPYFFAPKTGVNMMDQLELVMSENPDGTYTYANTEFFPIDGKLYDDPSLGMKRYGDSNNDGKYHNYHFCLKINSSFRYKNQTKFSFYGDDDVWLFINNKLVLDLGGVHSSESGEVYPQNLGLTPNQIYDFDFFFCERHTSSSKMKMTTDIEPFCKYHDFCGVCNGLGECCIKGPGGSCDDHNSCTNDTCPDPNTEVPAGANWTSLCKHTPVPISTDKCSVFDGSGSTCKTVPIDCDNSPSRPVGCYKSSCNATSGCIYTPSCFGTDKCLVYTCTGSQCKTTNKVCPPKPCFSVSCESTSGDCIYTPTCSATDACTCTNNICQNPNCVWDSKCTTKPTLPGDCGVANATCDYPWTQTANCMMETCEAGKVRSQSSCISNNCELRECLNGTCTTITNLCDDHNLCTADTCTGDKCYNTVISCDDGNPCTIDSCNSTTGCVHTPLECASNSSDLCTVYTCEVATGNCVPAPKVCPSSSPCNIGQCDITVGCINVPKDCNSDDECEKPYCENGECKTKRKVSFNCNSSVKAGVISGAAVAGIVVGAAVAVAIMAYGGKKGYDHWKNARNQRIGTLNNNPLFEDKVVGQGTNPLFNA